MRAGFNWWWLLPIATLAVSVLVALGIVVFQLAQGAHSEMAANCSGALANDYSCHQERYQGLVRDYGVETAFTELKDEDEKNDFVHRQCHQLTHVIGRAAAQLYGDIPSSYSKGDAFCGMGYYHGVMEAVVANIGADKVMEEANTLCADLREQEEHSFAHRDCVHGLGHGLLSVSGENELFQGLQTCDTLMDEWEKENCYEGAFMENTLTARNNPNHPSSKYLKADQPLYPCTNVQDRYKNSCYRYQVGYALNLYENNFRKVFELCSTTAEEDFRPVCYEGLGWYNAGGAIYNRSRTTDSGRDESTSKRCRWGNDEAQSNCIVGAAKFFVKHLSYEPAKQLCESFDANFSDTCLRAADDYYQSGATNRPLST